jgi:hypothetical protein
LKKIKTNVKNSASKVIHVSEWLHTRLKLHTALKNTRTGNKVTIAQEADQAIKEHISREGYV